MLYSWFIDSVKQIPKRIAKVFYDQSTDTLSTPTLSIEPNTSTTNELRFKEIPANGTNYVGFKAPTNIASSLIWELPDQDGTAGEALITDGSGKLSFGSSIPSFMAKQDFDVTSPSGQTSFDTGIALELKNISVFENGITRRVGLGYDYVLSDTSIVFNYTVVQDSWVSVYIGESLNSATYDFTVVIPEGQTTFATAIVLTDRTIQVFQNGILRRQGASEDFDISGVNVIFNYTIPLNSWVKIIVF